MESFGSLNELKYECLLFDLDDTLYPLSSGINLACRKNIEEFMLSHLEIEESQVPKMCLDLYREYGTTMAGLKKFGYKFDDDEFHATVHGKLPYEVLKPDPLLRNLLLSTPQRKIVFTNGDRAHAAKVLTRLGLEDCFEGVICFETLNPPAELVGETEGRASTLEQQILCKPSVESMEAAIQIANINPEKTIFFDDSPRNIASAKVAGLRTVIVSLDFEKLVRILGHIYQIDDFKVGSSTLVPGADYALTSIHNMKEAIPAIWEGVNDHLQLIQSRAIETVVLA